jgi:hypothetical protein
LIISNGSYWKYFCLTNILLTRALSYRCNHVTRLLHSLLPLSSTFFNFPLSNSYNFFPSTLSLLATKGSLMDIFDLNLKDTSKNTLLQMT